MACPCCGPPPCCKNGYSTITFTLSGGTTGNPNECDGQAIPDCGRLNGSYVFSAEQVFNGSATGLERYITVRDGCTVFDGNTPVVVGPTVVRLRFGVTCKGTAGLEAYMTSGQLYSFARWAVPDFTNSASSVVDPEDGCVISASFGPSLPTSYTSGITSGPVGSAPGIWGGTCGGWPPPNVPTATVMLQITVSR